MESDRAVAEWIHHFLSSLFRNSCFWRVVSQCLLAVFWENKGCRYIRNILYLLWTFICSCWIDARRSYLQSLPFPVGFGRPDINLVFPTFSVLKKLWCEKCWRVSCRQYDFLNGIVRFWKEKTYCTQYLLFDHQWILPRREVWNTEDSEGWVSKKLKNGY